MKKIILLFAVVLAATAVYAQKSIDDLFARYSEKDGFTTVTINGNLLKFASCMDDSNESSLPASLTEIRILTQEDPQMKVENFYDMVIEGIDLSRYEEFMRVKESGQDVRMLVRAEGKMFKEFLLIAGGEDNTLIQIKGNMSLEDAQKFSEDSKSSHGQNLMSGGN